METARGIVFFIFWIGLVPLSHAQVSPVLFTGGGATVFDGWENVTSLNYSGYGGFPGGSTWPTPIGSNSSGSEDAVLLRLSGSPTGGGPFLATDSIYFGNFSQSPNALGGTLAVKDETPLTGVQTIVLQIQVGEALGYDFHDPAGYPVLKLNNSGIAIPASFSPFVVARYQNGTFISPETGAEPIYVNTWAFQWNLSAGVTVSSFQIEFSCVTHAQIYALRLDQSAALQTNQIFSSPSALPPPQISLLMPGTPQYDGNNSRTTVTHSFRGPANQTIDLQFSPSLTNPSWSVGPTVSTGNGTFTAEFSTSGDLRSAWSQKMFFRAKYSP